MALQELCAMRNQVDQLTKVVNQLQQDVASLHNDDPLVDNAKTWLRGAISCLSPPQTFKFLRFMEEVVATQRPRFLSATKPPGNATPIMGKPNTRC